jgi:hypothetical protein
MAGVMHCPCITCLRALSHAWHPIVHLMPYSLQAILSFSLLFTCERAVPDLVAGQSHLVTTLSILYRYDQLFSHMSQAHVK